MISRSAMVSSLLISSRADHLTLSGSPQLFAKLLAGPAQGAWSAANIVALAAVVTTASVAVYGILRTLFVERRTRRLEPRVSLDLDCEFFGPQQGDYLAELRLTVSNKGEVSRVLQSIRFRVRGIRAESPLQHWGTGELRASFPEKIMEDEMFRVPGPLPADGIVGPPESWYVLEPGTAHTFTYTTIVPLAFSFVLVHVMTIREPLGWWYRRKRARNLRQGLHPAYPRGVLPEQRAFLERTFKVEPGKPGARAGRGA